MITLQKLISRKSANVLGVNSGTSIDSLDLSIVKIHHRGKVDAKRLIVTPLLRRTVAFPAQLRTELMQMASKPTTRLDKFSTLDEALGVFIGRACKSFIKHSEKQGIKVDCIASHGQTTLHHPQISTLAGIAVRSTLQIGAPERIAAITEKHVVSHFRQADIALGGEGAPITTEAVYQCIGAKSESRMLVNIGGIANYFYLPAGKGSEAALAGDIGPGNMLMDQAAKILFNKAYDKSGALAKAGTVNEALLGELLRTGSQGNTKRTNSTGREEYGEAAIKKILKRSSTLRVKKHSILTTLAELTAIKIVQALSPMLSADKRLSGIYLTGGGAKNSFLTLRLKALFSASHHDCGIHSISALGMNPDAFEATCYAALGWMSLKGIAAEASKQSTLSPVLGRITQPPQKKRIR